MSDLTDLYQEMILEHGKHPRNFGKLDGANREAEGHNPLCGDQCRVYVDVEGNHVEGIRFEGQGCAISTASASLMTEAVKGLSLEEAKELFEKLRQLVMNDEVTPDSRLGKLAVFAGVRNFPLRVKCATLAWHTLVAAIEGRERPIRTE